MAVSVDEMGERPTDRQIVSQVKVQTDRKTDGQTYKKTDLMAVSVDDG